MEFTLICPNDGRVELDLEDISTIIFRGPESVEVVFVCPQCGSSLRAALRVPNLLVAAMELARYAEEMEAGGTPEVHRRVSLETEEPNASSAEHEMRIRRERAGEPYCEYFRRQLASIESWRTCSLNSSSTPHVLRDRRAPLRTRADIAAGSANTSPVANPPMCANHATPPATDASVARAARPLPTCNTNQNPMTR